MMNKNFLWNRIPAVFYKNKYIIFSPYCKKITTLTKQELSDKKVFTKLKKEKFFGTPSKIPPEQVYKALTVTLYLTPKCMLNCIYCFDDKQQGESCYKSTNMPDMTPEIAISSLKKIIKNKNKFYPKNKKLELIIHFFGGEPTLKMNVIKAVVEFLEKQKIKSKFWISTNGVTSEENIKYMISKNFRFDIDCDGPPKIHDMQRPFKHGNQKSSYFTERMIKLLVKYKARFRTKVVVTKKTTKEMPNAVKYLAKLGVNHIRLEAVLIDGRAETSKLKNVEPKEFVKYFLKATETAVQLSKKYNRRIWISNWAIRNLYEPRDFFCQYVKGNRIAITANEKIVKCIRNLHATETSPFVVGKINEKGISLDKNKYQKLKNLSVDDMPKCKNCFAKYICSGGCYNENYKHTGNILEPWDQKCKLFKPLLRELIIKMYEKSKQP